MMSSTTPSKGVSTDINISIHDPSYARDSINGRFTNLGSNLTWESILPLKEYVHYHSAGVLGAFDFQGYTYLLIIEDLNFKVIRYDESNETVTELFARLNSDFGFSMNYLIRSCSFWINVSETKLRIYFTDYHTNPWSIDLYDPLSVTVPIQDLSFSPQIGTPILDLYQVTNGGSLLCGKYYYAILCYKNTGISTDWIMIHTPIEVPNKMPDDYTSSTYQSIEGGNSELKSRIAITLKLLNVTEFTGWFAKVAAFYAIDELTIDTGQVFYDGPIGSGVFTHSININLESVSVEIVKKNSLSIKKVGVITSNGEINVLGNIEINEMLPIQGGTFDNVKFLERPRGISLQKFSKGITTGLISPIILDKASRADIWSYNNPITIKSAQFSESVDANTSTKLSPQTYKKNWANTWNKDIKNYSPGFADYTNPHISFRNKVYRSGEPIRLALVPFDLYGKPLRPLWLDDLVEIPYSNMIPSCQLASTSTDNLNWSQRETEGAFFLNEIASASRLQLDFNWIEILGIDLKDFQINGIPTISGFSIVQAEAPIKRILTEGFFTGISRSSWGPNIIPSISLTGDRPPLAGAGWIILYSPDYFFNGTIPEPGDKIYATSRQSSVYADRIPEFAINGDYVWCHLTKMYYNKTVGEFLSIGTIEEVIELPNLPDIEKITVAGYGDVRNGGRGHEEGRGMGNKKGLLIKLKNEAGLYNFFETDETIKQNFIDYWTYRIEKPGYGFASQQDSDLAKTVYNFIGHYQPVNTNFFTEIKEGNEYKCDISVYGGQYYGNIFEVMRLSRYLGTNGLTSQIVFMPVLSRFNIRMRSGNRYSKNRTLGNTTVSYINIDGIGIATGRGKYEDFLFAKSYLSKNIHKDLVPVSNDFILNTKINNVAYWSEKQSLQGSQDSFRKIYSSSYVICSLGGKDITGFEFLKDKLIVFQRQAIGFLPYNERMLANMSNSTNLIISYGSIFPKYESIDTMNGIDHNLMKVLTPNGIIFYNDYDKTLNVLGDSVDDFGRKLGILALLKNQMTNISKLVYSKDEKKLHILSDKKILEICLNPIIVNGVINYDLANILDILSLGSKSAIINRTGVSDSNTSYLYKEASDGTIELNSLYSLTLIIGSDRPDVFNKIFDNLIIHTSELLTPESIKFTAGNSSIEESITNNPNALINGSIIYTSIPFIPVLNTGGIKNTNRIGNNSVCTIELKSTSRFNLSQIICNYRSSK